MDENQIARFWEKVDKSGRTPEHCQYLGACWAWTGRTNTHGYGRVSYRNPIGDVSDLLAHRVSWFITNGATPEGIKVLHKCDNPPCVNPAHLFLGTQLDNVKDMQTKGRRRGLRHGLGAANNSAKLAEEDVRLIRERSAAGETFAAIAFDYGMTRPGITLIVKRKTWKHVP
jgi:HNH endonuclease